MALNVFQLPGSNALETAKQVYAKMKELSNRFPEGLKYKIVYDTTPFIRESVNEVFYTLRDAVILVSLVMLVFLQSWRAAIIPLIAVPVAIVGTFAVMAAFRFSLNNLSLFGLVLAIGIVVDDAIVVVENIERWLDQGLAPRDAARKAMDEVTGPVIAVGLVLFAVFIPGRVPRRDQRPVLPPVRRDHRRFDGHLGFQFAHAESGAGDHPAAAARRRRDPLTWLLDITLGWFFRLFNAGFTFSTGIYVRLVGMLLRVSLITMLVYGGLLGLTYWQFNRTPTGFIPQQDKGYLLLNVQLPDSASVERTEKAMAQIESIVRNLAIDGTKVVAHTVGISGQSLILGANAPNLGSMYVMLKDFAERRGAAYTADAIAEAIRDRCQREVRGAIVSAFGALPIDGLGTTGGFKLIVEDRGNLGLDKLQQFSDQDRQRRQSNARTARLVQQFAGEHALAVPGHRPDQVHGLGRAGQRRFQHAAGLSGLVLREQLQRVRPDVAGQRSGRPAFSRQGARYSAASGPQQLKGR